MASYLRSKSTKLVALCCTAVSLTPLCVQPPLSKFFMNDPKHYWFLCNTMIRLHTAQWCHWHRCDMHGGFIDTPVQIWHRCDFGPHIRVALATFKENIYRKNIRKFTYTISIVLTQKIWGLTKDIFCHSGVIDTAVTKIGEFIVEFFSEFEAIFKKVLTRVSGA
jgi:hypothetical protein